jgi:predicted ester cyclase
MNIPATGRRVSVHGILHGRVEGGRIVEDWELFELAGMDRRPGLEEG